MARLASPKRRLVILFRKARAEYLEEVGACDDPEDPLVRVDDRDDPDPVMQKGLGQLGVRVLQTGGDLLRGRVLGDRVAAAFETLLDRLVDRLGHERRGAQLA